MTEEIKEGLGTLWAKALAGTFEHIRKFLAVYIVFTGIFGGMATGIWTLLLRPAFAAEMKQELAAELNAPCLKDEDGNRQNTLACNIEADAEAIQRLSTQLNEARTNQTIIQSDQATIKADQQTIKKQNQEILFLLQKAYPTIIE